MFSEEETSFEKILQRLKGVYMTLYILPNDDIGGVFQFIKDNGEITLTQEVIPIGRPNAQPETNIVTLNIVNVNSIHISNDGVADGSPLSIAFKKAQNQ